MNIYLTAELKARMRPHDLNWSRIASTAFLLALEQEEQRQAAALIAQLPPDRTRASACHDNTQKEPT